MEWISTVWPWMHIAGRVCFGLCFTVLTSGHFTQLAGSTAYAASKKVPMAKNAVIVSGLMTARPGLRVQPQLVAMATNAPATANSPVSSQR